MPDYKYTAINTQNKQVSGEIFANSQEDAASMLEAKSLTPVKIKERANKHRYGVLPAVEKITFCRYFATMLKSGLSITETIDVLLEESTHPILKNILQDVKSGLAKGQTLSSIFSLYPRTFDKFFLTLVQTGEVSGTLSETFENIQEEVAARYALSQKIKSALLYPLVVILAMVGIGVLMFFFILPQIGRVFFNLNLPLNFFVRTLFGFSIFLSDHKIVIIILSLVVTTALGLFLSQTRTGKHLVSQFLLLIPVTRNLVKQLNIARFCRVFSTLLHSGVPITQSLEIALESLSFENYRRKSEAIKEKVSQGKTMAEAFKQAEIFPPLLIQMMVAGEKSGNLDETMADMADFYEDEVGNAVKQVTELLEPVLMLLVGIGVGVMILAVVAPIYSVVSNIQSIQ